MTDDIEVKVGAIVLLWFIPYPTIPNPKSDTFVITLLVVPHLVVSYTVAYATCHTNGELVVGVLHPVK